MFSLSTVVGAVRYISHLELMIAREHKTNWLFHPHPHGVRQQRRTSGKSQHFFVDSYYRNLPSVFRPFLTIENRRKKLIKIVTIRLRFDSTRFGHHLLVVFWGIISNWTCRLSRAKKKRKEKSSCWVVLYCSDGSALWPHKEKLRKRTKKRSRLIITSLSGKISGCPLWWLPVQAAKFDIVVRVPFGDEDES